MTAYLRNHIWNCTGINQSWNYGTSMWPRLCSSRSIVGFVNKIQIVAYFISSPNFLISSTYLLKISGLTFGSKVRLTLFNRENNLLIFDCDCIHRRRPNLDVGEFFAWMLNNEFWFMDLRVIRFGLIGWTFLAKGFHQSSKRLFLIRKELCSKHQRSGG